MNPKCIIYNVIRRINMFALYLIELKNLIFIHRSRPKVKQFCSLKKMYGTMPLVNYEKFTFIIWNITTMKIVILYHSASILLNKFLLILYSCTPCCLSIKVHVGSLQINCIIVHECTSNAFLVKESPSSEVFIRPHIS